MDEEGTVAVVASMLSMICCADEAPPPPPPPKEFIADHPFMYALMTESSDVLFIGTYGNR